MDWSYILIEACDKEGNVCPLEDQKIDIALKGPGKIAGVGNGNPQSMEPFQAKSIKLFYGKAMLILGSKFEKGTIEITTSSNGLKKLLQAL